MEKTELELALDAYDAAYRAAMTAKNAYEITKAYTAMAAKKK